MRFLSLQSGSAGNCQLIESKRTRILVDCGLTGKETAGRLSAFGIDIASIDAVLITHEHRDHTSGVGVIARRHRIPVYANAPTHAASHAIIRDLGDLRKTFDGAFVLGDLQVTPFAVSHDAAAPVGFVFDDGTRKVSIITDTGSAGDEILSATRDSDLYYIESNYDPAMLLDGPYPYHLKVRVMGEYGHLANEDAGAFLLRSALHGHERAILAHLSGHNNTESIAYRTVETMLRDAGNPCRLHMSHRYTPGEMIEL